MAILITGEKLKDGLGENGFIKSGDSDCVEGIKYDFRFSGRFLKAKHKGRIVEVDSFPTSHEDTQIEPGEAVFVLTQEVLQLPDNIKAELSPKRKLAHEGVLVLGGFCVDPLYHGPLVVGIYNFGSRPFPLVKGKKLIAAQFYRLEPEECGDFPAPSAYRDFPDDLKHIIGRFEGISNIAVSKRVDELTKIVEDLKNDLNRREEWFSKFERSIDDLRLTLGEMKQTLENEIQQRKLGEDNLSKCTDPRQSSRI